ncbi:hypothetical protein C7421_112134 [Pantoea ananatis]|nr:hypothetical protein C7421_112134 [Pantoea ananatis]
MKNKTITLVKCNCLLSRIKKNKVHLCHWLHALQTR